MKSASASVLSIYCVNALGGGETSLSLSHLSSLRCPAAASRRSVCEAVALDVERRALILRLFEEEVERLCAWRRGMESLCVGNDWLTTPTSSAGLGLEMGENSPSTPLDISSRSSIQLSCLPTPPPKLFRNLLVRLSILRSILSSSVSFPFKKANELCVDMDDCKRVLDISSACTLRSRSESR